jgi:transcriptional regulator with XRE-family HTH domain
MPTESVGILISRARHRKRLTQEQMAEALGVSKSSVANWESGEHFPLRYAGAIEELLEITIPAPAQS